MSVKYSNNASTTLSAGISSSDTTINIASASKFPTLSVGDYYYGTIANTNNTKIEVVKITAATSTTLTAVRGLDDTTAQSFDSGDNFQIRVTAGTLESATSTDVSITGGSINGSVIDSNTIGADALNVSGNGTAGQYLGSDGDGTMTWTSISSDPSMGGDLSGTASNAQIVANAVTDTELNSAKLNGIEAGATADQTNAEIKTAYEANANTNEFSDAEKTKLAGIATSANNYTHPSHPGDDINVDTGALTGATVVSDIDINVTTDTSGHVTDANGVVSTRTLTLADLGYTPPASFPSGTKMVFAQAAAPTGWTKDTSNNDKALRVVSGSGGGTGGTHAFSSPPSTSHTHTGPSHTHSTPSHSHSHTLSAGAHTLSTSQMPSHNHTASSKTDCYTYYGSNYFYSVRSGCGSYYTKSVNNTGGGGSHSHSLSGSISSGGSGTSGAGGTGATSSAGPTAFAPQYVDVIVCSKD